MSATIFPFVSVVIPTFRDWDRLTVCLAALCKQTYPKHLFEIIVVNNCPGDAPLFEMPNGKVSMLEEVEPGSYAARNTGIRYARGAWMAFTDADCIPAPNWIENAMNVVINTGSFRVAGNIKLVFQGPKLTMAEKYEKAFSFRQPLYVGKGVAATANMFASRHLFEEVGYFNSELLSGGDFDWGARAELKGFSIVYADNAIVAHSARTKIKELLRKTTRVAGGKARRNDRAYNPLSLRSLWKILASPLADCIELKGRQDLTFEERLNAIFVRYALRYYAVLRWGLVRAKLRSPERL